VDLAGGIAWGVVDLAGGFSGAFSTKEWEFLASEGQSHYFDFPKTGCAKYIVTNLL
jgi:hypothetical protein